MKLVKRFAWFILRCLGLAELVHLERDALRKYGWIRSARSGESVGPRGEPLPWITYPAIYLLESRSRPGMKVFEFGCGNSTLWWAGRAAAVESVEHDQAWFERVSKLTPKNVVLKHVPLVRGGAYSKTARGGGPYDVVFVDGRDRVNCIKSSVESLSPSGVLVLDNSEREEYLEGIEFLRSRGFRQLPLRGLCPIVETISETSIFYRDGNVLGL